MRLCRLIKMDLKIAMKNKGRFLVWVFIVTTTCLTFEIFNYSHDAFWGNTDLSYADLLAFIEKGCYPLVRNTDQDLFIVPAMWMVYMLMLLFIPLDQAYKSMGLWGNQYVIRVNKREWWLSKSITTIIVNLVTWALFFCVTGVFCCIRGYAFTLTGSQGYYEALFGEVDLAFTQPVPAASDLLILVILPIIGTMTLCMIQMVIAVFFHPVAAYFVSLVLLVLTVYTNSCWIIPNMNMAIRSSVIETEGTDPVVSLSIGVLAGCIVFLAGYWAIPKKDLVNIERRSMEC